MKRNISVILLKLLGILTSTLPPLGCIISFFPLWQQRGGDHVISGLALLLIVVSFLPLYKIIKKKLESPSVHTVWLIIFIFFFLLSRIADEITVISFVGFLSNVLGALFFKIAERKEATDK
jgi:chromate transport protein ChrA